MPKKQTIQRSRRKAKKGRAPSTQAGEFVREEVHHIRQGRHGARSAKQAIAIGLSKARRAGVPLPPRGRKKSVGKATHRPSKKRSRAISSVLRGESNRSASPRALSRQTRRVAQRRGPVARRRAAKKAVSTKGRTELRAAARKAARSRRKTA